jgi:hypothetical protein
MLNFPASPTEGQLFAAVDGMSYVYRAPAWKQVRRTAEARNRIVNPSMQISQQNGDNSGSVNGFYPADQWLFVCVGTVITRTCYRALIGTPRGSPYSIMFNADNAP